MIGLVMSRAEVADYFRRAGVAEACAWEIAGHVSPEALESFNESRLGDACGDLLLAHIRRCPRHTASHPAAEKPLCAGDCQEEGP